MGIDCVSIVASSAQATMNGLIEWNTRVWSAAATKTSSSCLGHGAARTGEHSAPARRRQPFVIRPNNLNLNYPPKSPTKRSISLPHTTDDRAEAIIKILGRLRNAREIKVSER